MHSGQHISRVSQSIDILHEKSRLSRINEARLAITVLDFYYGCNLTWRAAEHVWCAQAVLVEEDVLKLEGLGTTVRVDGRKGKNIIREYDSGTTIRLQRALRDLKQQLPKTAVSPSLGTCVLCLHHLRSFESEPQCGFGHTGIYTRKLSGFLKPPCVKFQIFLRACKLIGILESMIVSPDFFRHKLLEGAGLD